MKVVGFRYIAVTGQGREVRNFLWLPGFLPEEGATKFIRLLLRIAFAKVVALQLEPSLSLRASTESVAMFTRRMAVMVAAGVPLHGAINFLAESEDDEMNDAAHQLAIMISSGNSFAHSLSLMPGVFPPAFIGFARAGESSGRLVPALESMATQLERSVWIGRRVRGALAYPFFLTVGAVLLSSLLLFGIVPMMTPTLQQLNVEMPALTMALLKFIEIASHPVVIIVTVLSLISIVSTFMFVMSPTGRFTAARRLFDRWLLTLPVFGKLSQQYASARILSAVGMSLDTGISVTKALRESSTLASNTVIEDRILRTCECIAQGEPLEDALELCSPFARAETQVLICTSESGQLAMGMSRMAKQAEEELDNSISMMTSLLEPVILGVMSIVVGTVCLATFLPWVSLLQSIL